MAVNTIVLDFVLGGKLEDGSGDAAPDALLASVEAVLKKHQLTTIHKASVEGSGPVAVFTGPRGVTATARIYPEGVITVTLELFASGDDTPFSQKDLGGVRDEISAAVRATKSRLLPAIIRGGALDPYLTSSDDRLLQYDFQEVVFEEQTPFQKVQIFRTANYGNALVLDGLMNLAESDLVYTETLMQRGTLDYSGKTVLILGGGDGALLHELLKEKPAFVTMVDIDDVVMKACRKHLRLACGDSMDEYEGPHHKIIVDDALKIMADYEKEGRTFDVIFGDLTDIPISLTPQDELWVFFRQIITQAFRILAKDGVFLMHGNGVTSKDALAMFEEQLSNMETPVEHTKTLEFVPSFMEKWVFYQIKRRTQ